VFVGFPAIEALGTLAVLAPASPTNPIEGWSEIVSAAGFFLFPGLFAGPLGEEIGWRGVALPRLQERMGLLVASLVLWLLWAFWHAPLWFAGQWTTPWQHRHLCLLDHGGDFHFHVGLQQHAEEHPDGHPAARHDGRHSKRLPPPVSAGEMTELGVLAMYLGLAAGFGVFSLFLIAVTKGRLGYKG
jgi:membrane protease YdiL (CAAX protease family)